MGYVIAAVIAPTPLLRSATRGLAHARPTALRQGLALLPVTDEFVDADHARVTDDPPGFVMLTEWLAERITVWSSEGPVAYVEADYFGGTGAQLAVVWERGAIVLGPLSQPLGALTAGRESPISRALRRLGVVTGPGDHDEFEAAGMRGHRSTDRWSESGVPLPDG